MLEIVGQVDCGHPAAAELALEHVTPFESGLQTGEHLIHDVPVIQDPWQYAEQGRGSQRWRAGLIGDDPVATSAWTEC